MKEESQQKEGREGKGRQWRRQTNKILTDTYVNDENCYFAC